MPDKTNTAVAFSREEDDGPLIEQLNRTHLMSIVKRENSKYWYMSFQLNGQQYIRSTKTTNKKTAEQMEIEWKSKIHSQQYQGRKQRITLADAFSQYKISKQEIASYSNLVAHGTVLCRLLPMKKYMDELTSHDLERFKQKRIAEGVGAEIIKYGLLLIKGTWKFGKRSTVPHC